MFLKHEGQEYDIPGYGIIYLYPVSKLLEALTDAGYPKTPQTVRKWEFYGTVPKSIFKRGRDRLYSQEQIDCFVKCVVLCKLKSFFPSKPSFSAMMWEELPKVNKMLKERKQNETISDEKRTDTEESLQSCC